MKVKGWLRVGVASRFSDTVHLSFEKVLRFVGLVQDFFPDVVFSVVGFNLSGQRFMKKKKKTKASLLH